MPQKPKIKSLYRQSLTDSVRQQLTHLIHNQTWKPGDQLPSEGDLAQRFGVSKPVVREALRGLAAMRVVEIQHGKLPTVCAPCAEPLEDFFRFAINSRGGNLREAIELRRALETYMIKLAAARITEEEIRELEECVGELRLNTEAIDPWVNADLKFHRLIAKSTKNGLMLHLTEALGELVRETIRAMHSQRKLRDSQATLRRHVQIFEALKARDPQRAMQAMTEHFDATEPVVRALVEGGIARK